MRHEIWRDGDVAIWRYPAEMGPVVGAYGHTSEALHACGFRMASRDGYMRTSVCPWEFGEEPEEKPKEWKISADSDGGFHVSTPNGNGWRFENLTQAICATPFRTTRDGKWVFGEEPKSFGQGIVDAIMREAERQSMGGMVQQPWSHAIPTEEHINEYRKRYGLEPYPVKYGDPEPSPAEKVFVLVGQWLAVHDQIGTEDDEDEVLLLIQQRAQIQDEMRKLVAP